MSSQSNQHDNFAIDPAFDALLRRAATLHDLAPEQNRRIRARLGFDAPTGTATPAASIASPLAATPTLPASSAPPAAIPRGRSTRRQWLDIALGSAALVLVALALAAIFRGMGDDSPQSPGVSASPEATVTAEAPVATATTAAALPATEYANANFWPTGIGSPGGIAVAPDGQIYIVDSERDVVQVFTPTGVEVGSIAFSAASADGPPGDLDDIAIGPDGSIFVLDTRTLARVLRYAPNGSLIAEWGGTLWQEPGSVFGAWSIAVDDDGFVYVADGQSRLQKFTGDGELIDSWDRAGEYLFPSSVRQMQVHDGSLYMLASGYRMPGNLTVILRFDLDGNLNAEPLVFDDEGGGVDFRPSTLAVGPDGSLFVASAVTREVAVQTLEGEVITRWTLLGSPESRPEFFPLTVAPDGTVYVAHSMRQLVQVFVPVASDATAGETKTYSDVTIDEARELVPFPLLMPEPLPFEAILHSTTVYDKFDPSTGGRIYRVVSDIRLLEEPQLPLVVYTQSNHVPEPQPADVTSIVEIEGVGVAKTVIEDTQGTGEPTTIVYAWTDSAYREVAATLTASLTEKIADGIVAAILRQPQAQTPEAQRELLERERADMMHYDIPATCDVTPWVGPDFRIRQSGAAAYYIDGDGLTLGTTHGVLFAHAGNRVDWLAQGPVTTADALSGPATMSAVHLDTSESIEIPVESVEQLSLGSLSEDGVERAWTSAVVFPEEGCWRVTVELGAHSLDAVVYVYTRHGLAPEAGALPTPDADGTYRGVTFEQARQLLPFELVVPIVIPDGLEPPDIMLSGPPVMVPGGEQRPPNMATIYFEVTGSEPTHAIQFTQREGSGTVGGEGKTEVVEIGGHTVSRTRLARTDGSLLITYWWQRDNVSNLVITTIEPPLTEEMLRQLVEAIIDAEEMAQTQGSFRVIANNAAWTLAVADREKGPVAVVMFAGESEADLFAYADAVRALGPQAFDNRETIHVLITFRHPMSIEYANQLLQESGATALSYRIRTYLADGGRGTTGMLASPNGTLVAPADWGQGPVGTEGVFDVEAVLDRDGWELLSQDPNVFLVDIMRAIAFDALTAHDIHDIPIDDIGINPPYTLLEEHGMVTPEG